MNEKLTMVGLSYLNDFLNQWNMVFWVNMNSNYHFKREPHKMDKLTKTFRRETADELFECVWRFCGVGA